MYIERTFSVPSFRATLNAMTNKSTHREQGQRSQEKTAGTHCRAVLDGVQRFSSEIPRRSCVFPSRGLRFIKFRPQLTSKMDWLFMRKDVRKYPSMLPLLNMNANDCLRDEF